MYSAQTCDHYSKSYSQSQGLSIFFAPFFKVRLNVAATAPNVKRRSTTQIEHLRERPPIDPDIHLCHGVEL